MPPCSVVMVWVPLAFSSDVFSSAAGPWTTIERATRQKIEQMQLPSVDAVNERRVAKFLDKIEGALASDDLSIFRDLV